MVLAPSHGDHGRIPSDSELVSEVAASLTRIVCRLAEGLQIGGGAASTPRKLPLHSLRVVPGRSHFRRTPGANSLQQRRRRRPNFRSLRDAIRENSTTPRVTLRRPIPGHRVHVFDRAAPGEGGGRRTRRGDEQPWGRGPRRSHATDPTLRRFDLVHQPAGEPWWSPSTHTPCLREHALRLNWSEVEHLHDPVVHADETATGDK